MIIHGACPKGADKLVDKEADRAGFDILSFPADWSLGFSAGPIRNQRMIDEGKPDFAYFFWDGVSAGTSDCLKRVIKARIPYTIVPYKGREKVVAENHYRLLGVQVEMFDKPNDCDIIEP